MVRDGSGKTSTPGGAPEGGRIGGGVVRRGRRLRALTLASLGALLAIGVVLDPLTPARGDDLNRTSTLSAPSQSAHGDFARRVKIRGGRKQKESRPSP